MRVAGFTFIRNGVTYDYPFIESLRSLLPLCDDVVVAVGASKDDTRDRILALGDSRIRLTDTVWDDSLRSGGRILAQQTNIALAQVRADWAIYLQGDEILHEADYVAIREAMKQHSANPEIEGLLFRYVHFFGSYEYIGDSRRWYRKEVRIVRPGIGVESWGDAQGFRINGRKLRVKEIPATVYHYGWVKPPEIQQRKQRNFNKYWHSDEWVSGHVSESPEYDYANGGRLKRFDDSHPSVMHERVALQNWKFHYRPEMLQQSMRERMLDWIERQTGRRIGEYRNYELV
jgi:glycosyltransferase involved in cell wall biosynthesis